MRVDDEHAGDVHFVEQTDDDHADNEHADEEQADDEHADENNDA